MIEKFGQYLQFIERIESPWVGLELRHRPRLLRRREIPQEWVARMARITRHYHFEDIAATRVHQHLIPGEGAIDFAATLAEIAATGYHGWITVELYPYIDNPDTAARRAREHLLGVLEKLGLAAS